MKGVRVPRPRRAIGAFPAPRTRSRARRFGTADSARGRHAASSRRLPAAIVRRASPRARRATRFKGAELAATREPHRAPPPLPFATAPATGVGRERGHREDGAAEDRAVARSHRSPSSSAFEAPLGPAGQDPFANRDRTPVRHVRRRRIRPRRRSPDAAAPPPQRLHYDGTQRWYPYPQIQVRQGQGRQPMARVPLHVLGV